MPAGRPIVWDEEKRKEASEKIFDKIIEGKSLRSILDYANREEYPALKTFLEWLSEDKELSKQYAHACEQRADLLFDEILEIADEKVNDIITDQEGNVKANMDVVQRARLQIDARKWVLSKMVPKKYGEKTSVELSTTTINVTGAETE